MVLGVLVLHMGYGRAAKRLAVLPGGDINFDMKGVSVTTISSPL